MASLPQDKLDALETRFQYVEAALSGGAGPDEFVKFSKEHAELAPIVGEIRAYNKAMADFNPCIQDYAARANHDIQEIRAAVAAANAD